MKGRIDEPANHRARYAQRFGVVEPVFGNLCYNKGLRRFTLRGQAKVDGQWKLFCLVHDIEKLARLRYAAERVGRSGLRTALRSAGRAIQKTLRVGVARSQTWLFLQPERCA